MTRVREPIAGLAAFAIALLIGMPAKADERVLLYAAGSLRGALNDVERKCNAQSHVFLHDRDSWLPHGGNIFRCTTGARAAAFGALRHRIYSSRCR